MNFEDLFKRYDPPPGGLERLRRRMAEEEGRSAGFELWRFARTASVVVTIALVCVVLPYLAFWDNGGEDPFTELLKASRDPSLVRYGLAEPPRAELSIPADQKTRLAALKVPVDSEDVIFYWIASTDTE